MPHKWSCSSTDAKLWETRKCANVLSSVWHNPPKTPCLCGFSGKFHQFQGEGNWGWWDLSFFFSLSSLKSQLIATSFPQVSKPQICSNVFHLSKQIDINIININIFKMWKIEKTLYPTNESLLSTQDCRK